MPASFVASFLIFLLTGGYSIYSGLGFTNDAMLKVYVSVALLANAVFYHYVACYTEMDAATRTALKTKSRLEWFIRVMNQCILLSLWFWLDHGWSSFGKALIGLYVSYLFWDWITWGAFTKHRLFWLDLAGTLLSVLYVLGGYVVLGLTTIDGSWEKNFYTAFGTLSFMYLALPIVGISILRFNPFKSEYWTRENLH